MALDDQRRIARQRLHETLAREFRHYRTPPSPAREPDPGDPNDPGAPYSPGEYDTVTARLDRRIGTVGNFAAGGPGLAEFRDMQPRLIFLRSEHAPFKDNVYVLMEDDERVSSDVYRVEVVDPPDGLTVSAVCVWLSESQAREYLV